jgi:uncharacterized protein YqjF (DUF2071 family)
MAVHVGLVDGGGVPKELARMRSRNAGTAIKHIYVRAYQRMAVGQCACVCARATREQASLSLRT